jgi:hypothetical protein
MMMDGRDWRKNGKKLGGFKHQQTTSAIDNAQGLPSNPARR